MTIIATATVPVFNRLDVATAPTLIQTMPGSCPAWCVTGPHELYSWMTEDDQASLHLGDETTRHVHGDPFGAPTEVVLRAQWLEGSIEPAHVYAGVFTGGATEAELLLTAVQAEQLAADLIAAAQRIRTGAAQ